MTSRLLNNVGQKEEFTRFARAYTSHRPCTRSRSGIDILHSTVTLHPLAPHVIPNFLHNKITGRWEDLGVESETCKDYKIARQTKALTCSYSQSSQSEFSV